jgi:L-asparaginase II
MADERRLADPAQVLAHDAYAGGELLAGVVRSGFVEGYHRGSVAVLDATGGAVAGAGDLTGPVFPRSANKPMQAVGMLRAGLRLDDPADLALAAASHRGEPMHIERVRAMLRVAGLTEDDLACPPDLPIGVAARAAVLAAGGGPERVLANCSGKHTAMLRTCQAAGWPTEGYQRADHPLQVALEATVEELTGEPAAAVGVDGCGAAVFAMSLAALAGSYLRLVSAAAGTAEAAVVDAMRGYPELVSGTGEPEARLMRELPGALVKGGAEGVLAVALPGTGAVAIKIDDGAFRPIYPVLASALGKLRVTAPVLDELAEQAPGVQLTGGGRPVGAIRALW